MSAYPSLLSPLMDATGLIATAALNTVAQTALASGVEAEARLDVLEPIALKAVANVYTGLPTSSMVIDGDITATEFRITNAKLEENKLTLADGLGRANIYANGNELWTDSSLNVSKTIQSNEGFSVYPIGGNATLECGVTQNYLKSYSGATLDGFGTAEFATVKATQVSGTVFQNNDSSFSVDFEGNATVKQLNYTTLFPAISADWVGTATSNLNMSGYETLNTSKVQLTNPIDDLEVNLTVVAFEGGQSVDFENSGISNVGNIHCGSVFAAADITCDGDITCPLINAVAPQFKPTYDYYVAKNGSDSGLGSVLSPFLTVQHAIDVCETAYDGTPRVIHLASGTYTQDITFLKSRISIIGENASMNSDVGSCIAGVVSISLTAGNSDLNNSNIYFSGLLINGTISDTTSGILYPHRVFFTNCYLYASMICLNMAAEGDYRLNVNNCTISNGSTAGTYPMININKTGMISITNTKITCIGLRQNALMLNDSVRVDTFANTIITCDSSSTLAPPIVVLNTSSTISMGNCAFIYSNPSVKSNSIYNSSGINMTSSGDLYILQCFFSLQGLYAPNHVIVNNGSGKVYFGNNIAPNPALACTIQGTLNTNKYAMVGIN